MADHAALTGKNILLSPCTREQWHKFCSNYITDPMMSTEPFLYDFELCNKDYNKRMADTTREYFSIIYNGNVIGRIYLKHINYDKKTAEFGIALINDSVKNKSHGTEAISLLLNYAFSVLKLETMIADTVLRNKRSQHVLQKIGFTYTHGDSDFKYYKLKKESLCLS